MTKGDNKREKSMGMLSKVVIFLTTILALHFFVLFYGASKRLEKTDQAVIQRVEEMGAGYLKSEQQIGDEAITDSVRGLDEKSTEAIELRTEELAQRIADFLYERDQDIRLLALMPPTPETFLSVYRSLYRDVIVPGPWPRDPAAAPPMPVQWQNPDNQVHWRQRPPRGYEKESRPLYREITFIDLAGREQIKIAGGAASDDLKDVSRKENTFCRAEDYFQHLGDLAPGEIYVSRVIGAYRPGWLYKTEAGLRVKPHSAYAGKENPAGERFEGIIRWATPVVGPAGKKTGYVTMALDHTHVMEFTDHVVTTEERFSDISDAGSGNYAWLWDDQDQCISHPRDFFICGYNPETGQPVPGWLSQRTYEEFEKSGQPLSEFVENLPSFRDFSLKKTGSRAQLESGNISLDCRVLDMAPQCQGWHVGSEDGGSGSFLIFWSGLWKLTTYAAVPYHTGLYANSPRGFGYVTLGANVDDFHKAATVSQANIEKSITAQIKAVAASNDQTWEMIRGNTDKNRTLLLIFTLALDLAVLCVLSFFISRMLLPLKRLTHGAEAISRGDLDQHIEVRSLDEIGLLATSFNAMATSLSKADTTKNRLIAQQEETNQKLTQEVEERKKAEQAVEKARLELEIRVEQRTAELKQSNTELQEAMVLANAASKAKSEFLANMSHELRTPLNGIIGMAELALDGELNDYERNAVHVISTEADSLLRIVNDILDFSKIEAGMLELEQIPFDIRILVEDLAGSMAWQAQKKGLEFISYISPEVPDRLLGDPGRLRQILVNLAGNALKFTTQGEVFIRVEMVDAGIDRTRLQFSVEDTGIGIAPDKQRTIFESFTQADGSYTRGYGGTGLGTTISKQLVELMDGEIAVDSTVGSGSIFRFTACFGRPQQTEKSLSRSKALNLKGLKVLVVDDTANNRFILTEYLRQWGCRTWEAENGNPALDLLHGASEAGSSFDLVLTDFQMPEKDGLELARQIKADTKLKSIPVLLLSSMGRQGDGRLCREIGIEGYLTKPVRQIELQKAIQSILGTSGESDSAGTRLVTRHTLAEEAKKDIHILLTEDYPTNQQVAMRHLEGAGYRVELAENGKMAVEAFKRREHDIILMDIQMPEMDGYQATRLIREFEEKANTRAPIIAMTAHALKGYREKCIGAGMDDFITKPLKRKDLLAMVGKWANPSGDGGQKMQAPPDGADTNNGGAKEARLSKDSPLDFQKAVNEFDGNADFLLQVMEEFIAHARIQTQTLRKSLADNDLESVMREAHTIKGGAANLTAEEIQAVAFELEKAAVSGDLSKGGDILDRLDGELARLASFVHELSRNPSFSRKK